MLLEGRRDDGEYKFHRFPWLVHWSNSTTCPNVPLVSSKQIVLAESVMPNGGAVRSITKESLRNSFLV
jgi:hypothetical protein